MKVYIGADYRGLVRKKELLKYLAGLPVEVEDLGCYEGEIQEDKTANLANFTEVGGDASAYLCSDKNDYNGPAIAVARAIREDLPEPTRGILICDSAHGMTMQANRFTGIRAANCGSAESAKLAREHDDANVLCLSAELTNADESREIVKVFLETEFEPLERRVRRINRLDEGDYHD